MRPLRISAVTGVFFIFYLIQFCFVEPSLAENQTGDSCAVNDGKTCGDCIKVDGCAFCEANKKCLTFSLVKDTYKGTCEKQQWKYKQCLLDGKVLLIALPVTGFVVLLILGISIYCCCCRRKKARGESKEETKWRRQREEIEIKHKERREERQKKHDEIRKKYGLFRKSDDSEEVEDGRYHRFDNTAVA
ncbi:pituitary tumor-transforming gene 1 protein-interacting protein-like [Acropora muricata]|uniref:pituitary tumor-transforming gene 1 protein-interacting protein-like n=1 Tax=Acropora muricata TaxID=159855 RepID=UPI0034E47A7B